MFLHKVFKTSTSNEPTTRCLMKANLFLSFFVPVWKLSASTVRVSTHLIPNKHETVLSKSQYDDASRKVAESQIKANKVDRLIKIPEALQFSFLFAVEFCWRIHRYRKTLEAHQLWQLSQWTRGRLEKVKEINLKSNSRELKQSLKASSSQT